MIRELQTVWAKEAMRYSVLWGLQRGGQKVSLRRPKEITVSKPDQDGEDKPGLEQGIRARGTQQVLRTPDESGRGPWAGHVMDPRPCSEQGVTRTDCGFK